MGSPFVGEIRIFAGTFAPVGWNFCDGTTLSISEFEVLFNVIGTTYGGDGVNTFQLPDVQGRFPIHQGTDYVIGQKAGSENVTLTQGQLPSHTHSAKAVKASAVSSPAGAAWAAAPTPAYSSVAPNDVMSGAALTSVGGGQPHNNMSPYLVTTFIISLFGIFPSQG